MNPYEVLGVPETASDEEIRKAYRELVKKYHPDQYRDNPLSSLAQEKLKEVNEAYDMIMKQRQGGKNAGGYQSGSYSGGAGSTGASSYSGPNMAEFARVRSMLNSNDLNGARQTLDGIGNHNGEWYYLDCVWALRTGNYARARASIEKAVQMDPQNSEYRQAYNSINNIRTTYTGNPYYSSGQGMDNACSICQGLICADCCCECMGGDLIRCC